MIYIGNHVSVSDGYLAMGKQENALGGDTFAFFPRNPRGGRSRAPAPEDVAALGAYLAENRFGPLVVHGAYTMNVCALKPEVRANSLEMLTDDLIARDVENGMDIGEAIAKEEFWAGFWDDMFNK